MNDENKKAMYADTVATLAGIGEDVSAVFKDVDSFIESTGNSFNSYVALMEPYVRYFFTDEGETPDTFFGDIVYPAKNRIIESIRGAISIMESDSTMHSQMYDAIERTQVLETHVGRIVELLEAVEIYSINTIIMSARAGYEGQTLATISGQMAALSKKGSDISSVFTAKMADLREHLTIFRRTCDNIDSLHEANITGFQLISTGMFTRLIDEFRIINDDVNGDLERARATVQSLAGIRLKFQFEDLLRQDIEKIHFMLECDCDDDVFRSQALFFKLNDAAHDVDCLHGELSESLESVNVFLTQFNNVALERKHSERSQTDIISALMKRIEVLKSDFTKYIELVLVFKNNLLQSATQAEEALNSLNSFFNAIVDISKKVQTIILLTRIDLARHDTLKDLLGGALTDVSEIPVVIARAVEEMMPVFFNVKGSLLSAVNQYRSRYEEQKKLLTESSALLNGVSVQVYESKKYHDEFLVTTESCAAQIGSFLQNNIDHVRQLVSYKEKILEISKISGEGVHHDRDRFVDESIHKIPKLREKLCSGIRDGDYVSMMLSSLLDEFMQKNAEIKRGSIEIF